MVALFLRGVGVVLGLGSVLGWGLLTFGFGVVGDRINKGGEGGICRVTRGQDRETERKTECGLVVGVRQAQGDVG